MYESSDCLQQSRQMVTQTHKYVMHSILGRKNVLQQSMQTCDQARPWACATGAPAQGPQNGAPH